MKPYKLVSREVKSEDSVININGMEIGGNNLLSLPALRCENREQLLLAAEGVKAAEPKC